MLDLECSNMSIWPGKLSNGVASTLSKLDAVIIRKINILKIDISIYVIYISNLEQKVNQVVIHLMLLSYVYIVHDHYYCDVFYECY